MLDGPVAVIEDETAFEPLGEDDEARLLRAFAAHQVRSIVIGGYAVRFFGCFRAVADLDLVVDPSPDNLVRMEHALSSIGVGNAEDVRKLFAGPNAARWRWAEGHLDHYVDLLTSALPFSFADLDGTALLARREGLDLRVISRDQLIVSKREALKDPKRSEEKKVQDREDLQCLEEQ